MRLRRAAFTWCTARCESKNASEDSGCASLSWKRSTCVLLLVAPHGKGLGMSLSRPSFYCMGAVSRMTVVLMVLIYITDLLRHTACLVVGIELELPAAGTLTVEVAEGVEPVRTSALYFHHFAASGEIQSLSGKQLPFGLSVSEDRHSPCSRLASGPRGQHADDQRSWLSGLNRLGPLPPRFQGGSDVWKRYSVASLCYIPASSTTSRRRKVRFGHGTAYDAAGSKLMLGWVRSPPQTAPPLEHGCMLRFLVKRHLRVHIKRIFVPTSS